MWADAAVQRVYRAVLYIEPRLFDPLPLSAVVDAAGGSLSELQRLFTAVYGISTRGYIRARRLSEGARMLRETSMGILEIALRCQYGSQAAFARAFRRYFEVPPGRFRRVRDQASFATVGPATVEALVHRKQLQARPTFVWQHTPRPLIGQLCEGDPDDLATFEAQQSALRAYVPGSQQAVGVAHRWMEDGHLSFFLGCDAAQLESQSQAPWVRHDFASGLYAVFTHRGPADRVRESIAFFSQAWNPGPLIRRSDRPAAEMYRLDALEAATMELQLWVPVDRPADS